jgi:hypothetical protein
MASTIYWFRKALRREKHNNIPVHDDARVMFFFGRGMASVELPTR